MWLTFDKWKKFQGKVWFEGVREIESLRQEGRGERLRKELGAGEGGCKHVGVISFYGLKSKIPKDQGPIKHLNGLVGFFNSTWPNSFN